MIAAFNAAQAAWETFRGLGRLSIGQERFDRLINRIGLREFKNRVWLSRRSLPGGGSLLYRPQDQCIVEEVVDHDVYRLNEIQPGQTVVDVGAHIGAFSVPAARRVGSSGRVFSYEPSTRTFALLEKNLSDNAGRWATANRFAISNISGVRQFYVSDDAYHNPAADTLEEFEGLKREYVSALMLDFILDGVGQVDHLKIDVEGAEIEVLKGAVETLKKTSRVVMEVHDPRIRLQEVLDLLVDFDIKIHSSDKDRLILHAHRRSV